MRCYECWNDVAAVPVLEADAASIALARQTQIDTRRDAQRASQSRRWRQIRLTTFAILAVAVLWFGYRTFIYQPPPVPLGLQPNVQLATGPDVWGIDAG